MKLLLGLLYVASLGLLSVRLAHDAAVVSKIQFAFGALRAHVSCCPSLRILGPLCLRSQIKPHPFVGEVLSIPSEADGPPCQVAAVVPATTLALSSSSQSAAVDHDQGPSTPSLNRDIMAGMTGYYQTSTHHK
ncbi:hypothetical protein C8R45DRAFT_1068465 [Mycena sanguinolenta]|nr:hypothetical protein C8R45DRAFT_1068465 [Mycena sanguinolenta]